MRVGGEGLALGGKTRGSVLMQTTRADKQNVCFRQTQRERERERERAEQDGCHLLIYSWTQPYRDVAGGCTVDVHKGSEAKCGKFNIDLECIWKVI